MKKLDEIWAKTNPFQSITAHGLISGYCAEILYKEYLCSDVKRQLLISFHFSESEMISFLGYFVSLHDIGKIAERFQSRSPRIGEKIRHEKTTTYVLKRIWKDKCHDKVSRVLYEILGAHHQGKHGTFEESDDDWIKLQNEFEKSMREEFLKDKDIFPNELYGDKGVYEAILLGITVLSDWIASGSLFENFDLSTNNLEERISKSAYRFMHESGLVAESYDNGSLFSTVWPNIVLPRSLQLITQDLMNETSGKIKLLLIEAPMGEGKTEAAIYAAEQMKRAWNKNGFYIALPTSATSNQMQDRVENYFNIHKINEHVQLLHSTAWLKNEETIRYNSEEEKNIYEWLSPLRRGLLAPYAVGTVDQALLSVMLVRYSVLRLLGLADKVLIIDEIHAYDLYMLNILNRLLEWCNALNIPVILLSATLPFYKKIELFKTYKTESISDIYPGITAVTKDNAIICKNIDKVSMNQKYWLEKVNILGKIDKIADLALQKVEHGGCLCVLLNTINEAQKLYKIIEGKNQINDLMIFHSHFTLERRDSIEKLCTEKFGKNNLKRPKRAILIATQVVEQSLDVDFDYMISAIAPMDLLIQRMGRLFRHKETVRPSKKTEPIFTVLLPESASYGSSGYVYSPVILKQTEFLLKKTNSIKVPEDIERLVTACYSIDKVPKENLAEWESYQKEAKNLGVSSDKYIISEPSKRYSTLIETNQLDVNEQSSFLIKTRIGDSDCRLIFLGRKEFDENFEKSEKHILLISNKIEAKNLLKQSVTIREKRFFDLVKKYSLPYISCEMMLEGTYIISDDIPELYLDKNVGLVIEEKKNEGSI